MAHTVAWSERKRMEAADLAHIHVHGGKKARENVPNSFLVFLSGFFIFFSTTQEVLI